MRKDAVVRGLTELFPYTFRENLPREHGDQPMRGAYLLRCEALADKYHVVLLSCFEQGGIHPVDDAFCNRVRRETATFFYEELLRLQSNIYAALGHALDCREKFPVRSAEYKLTADMYEQIIRDLRRIYERIMNEIEDCLAEEVSHEDAPVFYDVIPEPVLLPFSKHPLWQKGPYPMDYAI